VTIAVVDNNEDPTSPAKLRGQLQGDPDVRVYGDGKNRGYFGGAAFGFANEGNLHPAWVLVSNCDVFLRNERFFEELSSLEGMCRDNRVALVAPSILSGRTGRDQNPHYRTRPLAWKYRTLAFLFRSYAVALVYRGLAHVKSSIEGRRLERRRGKPEEVYAGHGSFVILHKSFFDAGGTLDYDCFLYCEEVHLAEQIRERGLKVIYWPKLQVCHAEHATIRLWPSRKVIRHLADAHGYVYQRYLRNEPKTGHPHVFREILR
jgi:GT2 family glycosyltransferase